MQNRYSFVEKWLKDFVKRVAGLNVLWKAEVQRLLVQCHFGVHQILQRHTHLIDFHELLKELHLNDGHY